MSWVDSALEGGLRNEIELGVRAANYFATDHRTDWWILKLVREVCGSLEKPGTHSLLEHNEY